MKISQMIVILPAQSATVGSKVTSVFVTHCNCIGIAVSSSLVTYILKLEALGSPLAIFIITIVHILQECILLAVSPLLYCVMKCTKWKIIPSWLREIRSAGQHKMELKRYLLESLE